MVGAGPAGIAALGHLLDAGVPAGEIAWIDPRFKVGDFGTAWRYVSSNTPVDTFTRFHAHCASFHHAAPERPRFMIEQMAPQNSCLLMLAAEPLRWITDRLRETVPSTEGLVTALAPAGDDWQLSFADGRTLLAARVVLAIGAIPRRLTFPSLATVPLEVALDPRALKTAIRPDDTVVVFGSSQSAKSVMENLSKLETRRALLFYRSEATLERHFGAARRGTIEALPATPQNLLAHMPTCTRAIFAIGFERRHVPIAGLPDEYEYDTRTGEIAPGVFGLGIAFPEILPNEMGQVEYPLTAIWPYMRRLEKVLPHWLSSPGISGRCANVAPARHVS